MPKPLRESHFYWLTFALVGLLIAGALTREFANNFTIEIIQYSSIALLLISLLTLASDRKWARWFFLVVGAMLVSVVARGFSAHTYYEYGYLLLLLTFMLMAAWLVGSHVLLTGSVDLNKIAGSVALYLLIGLIYSILYVILLEFTPHAIKGIPDGSWYDHMPSTTYFSFVTLTTLGYGDLRPATPMAEVIVVLEAVSGTFYFAIVVASLIGSLRFKHPRGD